MKLVLSPKLAGGDTRLLMPWRESHDQDDSPTCQLVQHLPISPLFSPLFCLFLITIYLKRSVINLELTNQTTLEEVVSIQLIILL